MACFDVPGDLELLPDHSGLALTQGPTLARDRLRVLCATAKTVWRYDQDKGLPWRDILAARPDTRAIEVIMVQWLMSLGFIRNVLEIQADFDRDTRTIAITFKAQTDDGETVSDAVGLVTA